MNEKEFLRHIENTRDCDEARLDAAINKGLRRAKGGQYDTKKFFLLAAAGVFTFAMCLMVNMGPFTRAVDSYYENWHRTKPGTAEVLDAYVRDINGFLEKYLGGE